MRISLLIALITGCLCLLVSCGDENLRHWPSVEANNKATLEIFCAEGCENWKGFKASEELDSSWFFKKVTMTGFSLDELKELRLSDRCASTPNVIVQISTDTDFQQTWYIVASSDGSIENMCTFGRNQTEQAKFDAFFRQNIVGLK